MAAFREASCFSSGSIAVKIGIPMKAIFPNKKQITKVALFDFEIFKKRNEINNNDRTPSRIPELNKKPLFSRSFEIGSSTRLAKTRAGNPM